LNSGNIDQVLGECKNGLKGVENGPISSLAENEFVFINFYADWCRFSNLLAPEWDKTADKAAQEFDATPGKVLIGKIDCDKEGERKGIFYCNMTLKERVIKA